MSATQENAAAAQPHAQVETTAKRRALPSTSSSKAKKQTTLATAVASPASTAPVVVEETTVSVQSDVAVCCDDLDETTSNVPEFSLGASSVSSPLLQLDNKNSAAEGTGGAPTVASLGAAPVAPVCTPPSFAGVSVGSSSDYTLPVTDVATMSLPGSGQRNPNSQQLLMLAEFSDGYSLRNLIEYLKASNTTTGRLIFSRERITFVRSNYQATVLNEVVFRTYDLPRYIYNSDQPSIVFGANMNNIRPITRSIGKKDSARLFMQKGDSRLYIQIISQNAKALSRENVNVIVSQNVEPEGYDLEEYVRSVDRPNCSVPCHDFTKMCGAMNSLKCSYVTARGFENGMTFIGMIEGNIFGRVDRFGECGSSLTDLPLHSISVPTSSSSPSNSQQPIIRISISIVKALSKINNLTSNGNIRMYFEQDRPLKLVCNVGTYGQLNIYLKEEDSAASGVH